MVDMARVGSLVESEECQGNQRPTSDVGLWPRRNSYSSRKSLKRANIKRWYRQTNAHRYI